MRKILLLLLLFASVSSFAQIQLADGYGFAIGTTAELEALNKEKGDIFYNSELEKHLTWTGTEFVEFGAQDKSLSQENQIIPVDEQRLIETTNGGNGQSALNIGNSEGILMSLNESGISFLNESPTVPTPKLPYHAATKIYVSDNIFNQQTL